MTIKSVYQLHNRLAKEMSWRRKELAQIKMLLAATTLNEAGRNTLLRAAVALLYGHWEAFIKIAATSYLEFLARQGHRCDELTSNFVALAMKRRLNEARQANAAEVFIGVAKFFLTGLHEQFNIDWDQAIDTQSNLKSLVLRDIVLRLGLDYRPYETREHMIDKTLLDSRNQIAHGQYLFIDLTTYMGLHDSVLELLDGFTEQIINAAKTKLYLRTP
jgi:hypothetical protein